MASKLILPNTPEIREYVEKRNAELAERGVVRDPAQKQRQRLEENSEYQRRKLMSRDEKYIGAIDTLVRARMIFYRSFGIEKTEDAVRKEMIEMVVRKYGRDHGIE